jgi:nephrocystin-3
MAHILPITLTFITEEQTKQMKIFKDRQVRLFISSTFGGMFEDRKVLIDHVFPEIRRRCSERGIGFAEIDLRWGITDEQFEKAQVVPICLKQIENCHPYFLGLLGEYYGSTIPQKHVKQVCQDYPWIEKGYLDRSITELEITYALFDARSPAQHQALAEKALFYFRDPNYANQRQDYIETKPENRTKQQNLKQRLREHGCQITEYQQPIDLKQLVLEPLWAKIDQEFPHTLTQQQREDFEHDAFAASRQTLYIKPDFFDRLNQHALSDDPPLVIVGESGSGKTALLANWGAEYREKHPEELVFWHFCGSSPTSTEPIALLQRIMASLKSHFELKEELPTDIEAIKEQFPLWLAKAQGRVILIIDGLNQLIETQATQGWLHSIPAKTCLFLSTISVDDEHLSADWQRFNLPLLTDKSARQALITEYLKQYGKTLDKPKMQRLLDAEQTANPLYLKVILEELRIFGDHYQLGEHLEAYLQAPSIEALYQKVLARLEADYQSPETPYLVENALSLLWAARWGLHESELLEILEIPQAIWSPLYLALQNALVSRAGLLSFFHDYLRQAVARRYLPTREVQQRWHLCLANYFKKQEIGKRVADELPWQLEKAGNRESLRVCISYIPIFLQLNWDKKEYELWGYWLRLEPDKTMVRAYGESLARYEEIGKPDEKHLGYVLNQLGFFFNKVGYFSAAIPLLRRALEIHEKVLGKEHPDTASSLNNLAGVYQAKGDYDSAEPLLKRATSTRKSLGQGAS